MPEEAEQPRDLITILRKEYEQQEGPKPTSAYTALIAFTEFSSEYLANNQPIATYYDEGGLGLQRRGTARGPPRAATRSCEWPRRWPTTSTS